MRVPSGSCEYQRRKGLLWQPQKTSQRDHASSENKRNRWRIRQGPRSKGRHRSRRIWQIHLHQDISKHLAFTKDCHRSWSKFWLLHTGEPQKNAFKSPSTKYPFTKHFLHWKKQLLQAFWNDLIMPILIPSEKGGVWRDNRSGKLSTALWKMSVRNKWYPGSDAPSPKHTLQRSHRNVTCHGCQSYFPACSCLPQSLSITSNPGFLQP